MDDDHRVDQGYLSHICEAAAGYPEADIFCGRILPDWDGTEPGWVHDTGPYRVYPLPVPRFDQGDAPLRVDSGHRHTGRRQPVSAQRMARESGTASLPNWGRSGTTWRAARIWSGYCGRRAWARVCSYIPQVVQYHHVDARRLTLPYVVKKAYKRTASSTRIRNPAEMARRAEIPLPQAG